MYIYVYVYKHSCFSELLILREKKVRGFSFESLDYQKKYKFSKHIKNTMQESCTKKGTILHQAP